MPHYPCHWRQNKPRTLTAPPPPPSWRLVSNAPTRGNVGRSPGCAHLWPQRAQVAHRVTLNFQRTQRSPSGVLTGALSCPPPTQLKGPSVTRHLLQWSGPPPHWAHRYSNSLQLIHSLLESATQTDRRSDCWFWFRSGGAAATPTQRACLCFLFFFGKDKGDEERNECEIRLRWWDCHWDGWSH